MDDSRGHVDAPGTREGHNISTGVDQPEVDEVVKIVIARNAEYPSDTGLQIPPLTNSSSDNEHESSCDESEIYPPQARNCGEVRGEMKTETKEYNANYIVVGSEDTYPSDE